MDNLAIYEKLREVPDGAKRTIGAGRLKGFTDVNPMWRLKALTEVFGPCGLGWYYEITDKRTETIGDEVLAFVDIKLYVRFEDGWSAAIPGTGGSKMASKEKNGIYIDDEGYKKALTDAISVATKALGMAADVYWGNDRTKYNSAPDKKEEKEEPAQTSAGSCITKAHWMALQSACKKKGVNIESTCKIYGVDPTKPSSIPFDKWNRIMADVEKMEAR